MNPIFTKMVDAVEAANAAPDDYINSADGLKYCGKCHTPKEAFFPADLQAAGLYQAPGYVQVRCRAPRTGRSGAPGIRANVLYDNAPQRGVPRYARRWLAV